MATIERIRCRRPQHSSSSSSAPILLLRRRRGGTASLLSLLSAALLACPSTTRYYRCAVSGFLQPNALLPSLSSPSMSSAGWTDAVAASRSSTSRRRRSPGSYQPFLRVHTTRDADPTETLLGGQRYSMVPLPDSMVATTVFVGNLCEFVTDDDLSMLFQKVSFLLSVPAVVVRKIDMTSLRYGFVTFPSEAEKEVGSENNLFFRAVGVLAVL